jgi:hypothetical protein
VRLVSRSMQGSERAAAEGDGDQKQGAAARSRNALVFAAWPVLVRWCLDHPAWRNNLFAF